jgi:hypothetical protein
VDFDRLVRTDELQQFIVDAHALPEYTRLVEPLHDVLQRGLAGLNKYKKCNPARIRLSDLGWSVKTAPVHAVTLAVPNRQVFTDPSESH